MQIRPSRGIRVDGITYQYQGLTERFQLGPIHLTIPFGTLSFWIGRNGSGKTTLARVLAGELRKDSGRVRNLSGPVLYHHQNLENNLFTTLRVREHLALVEGNSGRMAALLDAFPELMESSSAYPDELSGGQLQLLTFAAVAARRYQLYIFDELLNHLDKGVAGRVLAWIREELVTLESAVVFITHDLAAAAAPGHPVTIFDDGMVACHMDATPEARDVRQLLRLFRP